MTMPVYGGGPNGAVTQSLRKNDGQLDAGMMEKTVASVAHQVSEIWITIDSSRRRGMTLKFERFDRNWGAMYEQLQ